MISSMTGLGVGESSFSGQIVNVEIRSVNNRYLEVSTRLPASLTAYEPNVKEIVRKSVHRGKLYINITLSGEQNSYSKLKIVPESVVTIRRLLEALRREAGIEEPLKIEHFLPYTDIFGTQEKHDQTDVLWELTEKALGLALKNLTKMRKEEGSSLLIDILNRTAALEKATRKVVRLSKKNLPETHKKMVDRIRKLVREETLHEDRLFSEIAIMADKLDITEECVRLDSHFGLFRNILKNENEVGKKLNFLLQEMNREVNTISAKANSAEISHLVVSMKEEIEKLREQVQNLE
ncbi:YicC family protein [bacterium]|nr:YicC family protein [bacterium]